MMMALMVMMMMRMMSRFLSQKEVAWWSVSLGTHCHYLLSISITLKTIRKKLAQKLLIVFIISTSGLKLSLDLVFFRSDMDTCLLPLEEFSKLGAQLTSCKFVQLMQIRMSKYVSSYLRQNFCFKTS